jgi:predicted Zn-dependent protease
MFAPHPELPTLIASWFQAVLNNRLDALPSTNGSALPPAQKQALELLDEPGGVSKAIQMQAEARERDPKAAPLPEEIVNFVGYEHLQQRDTKGAVELMKLNTTAYPDSPKAFDSLSDAYLADGQKDLARSNAKRALDLLARDTVDNEQRRKEIKQSAEEKLKQLGEDQH